MMNVRQTVGNISPVYVYAMVKPQETNILPIIANMTVTQLRAKMKEEILCTAHRNQEKSVVS